MNLLIALPEEECMNHFTYYIISYTAIYQKQNHQEQQQQQQSEDRLKCKKEKHSTYTAALLDLFTRSGCLLVCAF